MKTILNLESKDKLDCGTIKKLLQKHLTTVDSITVKQVSNISADNGITYIAKIVADCDSKAIRVMSEQGLWVDIPNGDIEAVINADMSAKGLFMVDFTVTPMAVTEGKPIQAYDGTSGLTVDPTSLSFAATADSSGKTITATSSGSVTYAAAPSNAEWLTVTRNLKVVTVKVSANTNTESRTAIVTVVADGLTAYVPVTQAGA